MKITHLLTAALTSLLTFNTASLFAAPVSTNPEEKKQVETIVHDYLTKNPDVIIQALQNYQQQQMDQARKTIEKTKASTPKFANSLFHDLNSPSAGNPNGKITVVEFFDYQCPHCVEMTSVLESVVKTNPNVKIIFKEFPIRGPISEFAAKTALAAQMQGKYFEFHKALMSANKVLTEEDIFKLAQSVGLNVAQLKTDMNSKGVAQQIKSNYQLAQALELMGTPALFIAKSDVTNAAPATAIAFIPGVIDKNQLEVVLAKVSG